MAAEHIGWVVMVKISWIIQTIRTWEYKISLKNTAQQSEEDILNRKEEVSTITKAELVHEFWRSKLLNFNYWSLIWWFCFFTHGSTAKVTKLIFRWLCSKFYFLHHHKKYWSGYITNFPKKVKIKCFDYLRTQLQTLIVNLMILFLHSWINCLSHEVNFEMIV